MRFDDDTVEVKSAQPFFAREQYGTKPNTVRVVDSDEYAALMHRNIAEVCVVNAQHPALWFQRAIDRVDDITDTMAACGVTVPDGSRLVVISWTHPSSEQE